MAVTTTILKEHVETDLPLAALQRLIDDADEEIVRRYGSDASVTEEHILAQENDKIGRRRIWTKQQISSITSLQEGSTLRAADLTTLVLDTDFMVVHDGHAIERLDQNFQKRVKIVYVPKTDVKRRDRVTIDLCKLAIQYNALSSEKVGDWSGSHKDYQKEREMILSTLNGGRRTWA